MFGRRQTIWDTAFNLLSSSQGDRNIVTAFVQLICTAIVNFTAGMLSSVFIFVFQLPWLLMSYQVCPTYCVLMKLTFHIVATEACSSSNHCSGPFLLSQCVLICEFLFVQASIPSMVAFFGLAMLGCISVILSYLLGLYLAGATAIYATVSLTRPHRTLEGGRAQGGGALSQRPHNE